MKTNKKNVIFIAILTLLFITLLTFVLPNALFGINRFEKASFWISFVYLYIIFSFEIYIIARVWKLENKTMQFIKPFTLYYSFIPCGLTILFILFCLIFPILPTTITLIIYLISLFVEISTYISMLIIENRSKNILILNKEKTDIKFQSIECLGNCIKLTKNSENNSKIREIYDIIKYDFAGSTSITKEIDKKIYDICYDLETNILSNNTKQVSIILNNLLNLVKERNREK